MCFDGSDTNSVITVSAAVTQVAIRGTSTPKRLNRRRAAGLQGPFRDAFNNLTQPEYTKAATFHETSEDNQLEQEERKYENVRREVISLAVPSTFD